MISALLPLFASHFYLTEPAVNPNVYSQRERSGIVFVQTAGPSYPVSVGPGAQRIPMMDMTFTATCHSDVQIHAVELQRRGLGFNDDIDAVYGASGYARVTRSAAISSRNGTFQLRFDRFVIPACQTRTVTILANFSSTASPSGQHYLTLASVYPVDAGYAQVRFDEYRPVRSAPLRTVGSRRGRLSVSYLRVDSPVKVGSNRIVSRIRLHADGESDHEVHGIMFTNDGSARGDDLQNLFVDVSGQTSTVEPFLMGDRVRVDFNPPILIRRNKSRNFTLRADVYGSYNRSIRFFIEEEGDIDAREVRIRD